MLQEIREKAAALIAERNRLMEEKKRLEQEVDRLNARLTEQDARLAELESTPQPPALHSQPYSPNPRATRGAVSTRTCTCT